MNRPVLYNSTTGRPLLLDHSPSCDLEGHLLTNFVGYMTYKIGHFGLNNKNQQFSFQTIPRAHFLLEMVTNF